MEVGMQGSKKVAVKLGQLDSASVVLRMLAKQKLPFKASYWLKRNIDSVTRVYQPFFEAKQELFKEFAELDEKGNPALTEDRMRIKLIEGKQEEFFKQYNELGNKEVEFEIYPLELDWFTNVDISIEEIATMDFMIREEGEDVKATT